MRSRDLISPISLFSPVSLCLLSFLTAFLSWLIPSQFYTQYLYEASFYSYRAGGLLWVLLCTVAFVFGATLTKKIKFSRRLATLDRVNDQNDVFVIVFCSIIVTSMSFVYVFFLSRSLGGIGEFINVISSFSAGENRLRVYLALQRVSLGWIPQFTFPFVSFISFLAFKYNSSATSKIFAFISITSYTLTILPNQTKTSIISFILVIVFSIVMAHFYRGRLNWSRSLRYLALVAFAGISIFVVLQSVKRGTNLSDPSGIVPEIAGYGPASFNRLGAAIDNQLTIPNSGMGYYTNTWYWGLPGTDSVNSFLKNVGFAIPTASLTNYFDTFKYVKSSGLNDTYIWVTTYGEAYLDYGYFGLIWFVLYGIVSNIFWRSMVERGQLYIAVYAVFMVSGLQWYATASIGSKGTIFAVFDLLLLSLLYYLLRQTIRRGQGYKFSEGIDRNMDTRKI
jgi:oligosaccharide repeat unit polymerase